MLTKHLGVSKLLWAQYRLASDDSTRFPATLQDALTYYHYVVSLGIDPKTSFFLATQLRGNLVLALLRHLESVRSPELPFPGGAIVFSPWVKVTSAAAHDHESCTTHKANILTGPVLQWGVESYFPKDLDGVEAYISPLNHPFRTSVPLYVHVGAMEALHDSIKTFAEEMGLRWILRVNSSMGQSNDMCDCARVKP